MLKQNTTKQEPRRECSHTAQSEPWGVREDMGALPFFSSYTFTLGLFNKKKKLITIKKIKKNSLL